MNAHRLVLLALLATAGLTSGCVSNRAATVVKLDEDDYPESVGPEADPIEIAKFVKTRNDLALRLWNKEELESCITIMEGLVKHIPSVRAARYDLGTMYYQRAFPKIREYRKYAVETTEKSREAREAAGAEETRRLKAEAEIAERKMEEAYKNMRPDLEKCIEQLLIYSEKSPNDPKPFDMLWRAYLMLESYPEALEMITRLIKWEGILDDAKRDNYQIVQEQLRRLVYETSSQRRSRRERALNVPPMNPVGPGSSNR